MFIRPVNPEDSDEWLRLRQALWHEGPVGGHVADIDAILAGTLPIGVYVVERPDGRLGGFVEVGTRSIAEGCETSPVGYLEGWYIEADLRGQGLGAALVQAAEAWARDQGLTEMASDTWLHNDDGHRAHLALGYAEVERIVCFRKHL